MKRSEINEIIRESDAFIRSFGYVMPPFAYWSPEELKVRTSSDARAIRDARLGWDITDYGRGKFADLGLFLFTTRNGNAEDLKRGRRHALCREDHDLAQEPAFSDASPCGEG